MSHQREHWFVSRLGTLSERYIASHSTFAFDEYLNVVRAHCPTERHLVEFLESEMTFEELEASNCPSLYPTWQEASGLAVAAGVGSQREYYQRYKDIDSRLPSNPNQKYPDFPGWLVFLGTSKYPTWQEASAVVVAVGITTFTEYRNKYQEIDLRLPCNPNQFYPDFPDWYTFLGQEVPNLYPTWQEASKVSVAGGVRSQMEYKQRYRNIDLRLPSHPDERYHDFPGWHMFLGRRKTKLYPTWQEASAVAIAARVKTAREYHQRCKDIDPRLPCNPYQKYAGFPGWHIFLGREALELYPTWQEASAVAIGAEVRCEGEYRERYKTIDPRLPCHPSEKYPDFPSWSVFLGTSKYPTWQEASAVAIVAGARNQRQYKQRYKDIDPRLPSNPNQFYPNFPGWPNFLGKQVP